MEQVLYGLPFADENKMDEIRELMSEILALITTGDEDSDMKNVDRFAKMISLQQGSDIKQVREHLLTLRKQYF